MRRLNSFNRHQTDTEKMSEKFLRLLVKIYKYIYVKLLFILLYENFRTDKP